MKVSVRRLPETRVSEQQQDYARAVPGLDVSPITDAIEGFRNQLQEEQRDRQRFELNKRTMEEINELQADFEVRRRDPKISPVDFADTTNTVYQDRHKKLLDTLHGEGFDRDLIEELDLKLGTIRQGFFERGLGHQLQTLKVRAQQGAEDITQQASQYVAADYNGYGSARDMLRESLRLQPDLTETEREEAIDRGLGVLRDAGGKALAFQNPQFVIDKLDPQGFTAPGRAPAPNSATTGAVSVEGLDGDRGTVATTLSAGGLSPAVVAGFLGNFDVEGGYTGLRGDGGTASGIAQWRKERRNNFKSRFGKEPHQATKEEQAQFVLWELENPAAAGMTPAQANAIRNASTPQEAAKLIDRYYERSDGKHRSRRVTAAAEYANLLTVEVAPSASTESGVALAPPVTTVAEVQTGNALLDDMNGPERLQVLSWARENLNKVNASRKAEMDVAISNITAEALNNGGEIATPLPTEADVLSVYGAIEGPQRWAQIQQSKDTGRAIMTFRTQSAADIQRGLDAIEPKPGSPTYQTELQIYEAAERAAQHLLKERQDDPASYALKYFPSVAAAAKQSLPRYYAELDRVYESLGIDSNRAPLMSGDAARQITQDYKLMSPSDKLAFMRENYRGMGEDRFRRFVSNMEGTTAQEDARIYALLRTYPTKQNGEWATVFQQVLEGREIMAQDPARRPSTEEVNKRFQAQGLSAIANLNADASRAIQETAAALYVARGGNPDPKKFDNTLYKESLATALGGSLPANLGKGEARDFTILPPKVDAKSFQNWIERQTFEGITMLSVEKRPPRYGDLKTVVPISDIIDEGVFVMVSPGRYMIKMESDGKPLMTRTGRPFLVNIHTNNVIGAGQ